MKIKSLLLGSAAAMFAVSGSQAADAIIAAEPEPVEYVRVCDAFGSGYFYIPGTETCLKISGRVRMRVTAGDNDFALTPQTISDGIQGIFLPVFAPPAFVFTSGGVLNSYTTSVRGRLNIQAKSDTELGELHGYLRLQADNARADGAVGVDQAWMQLGGFLTGYTESAWNTTTNGGASGFGAHGEWDGAYGYQQRNLIQYQFNGGNWFGAISVEDDANAGSWTPDVVGRLGVVVGGVTVYGVVGYDNTNGGTTFGSPTAIPANLITPAIPFTLFGGAPASSEWGVKLGLNADIGAAGNLIVQGFYASGPTAYGANYGLWGNSFTPEWSVLASYQQTLTPEFKAYIHGQYFSDFYTPNIPFNLGIDAWEIGGGVRWDPVTNFSVTAEANYTDLSGEPAIMNAIGPTDNWNFLLQFQRDF
ncbi:MAG: porin [Hyphomicrobiales bacterium]|nr:porin [Hyphomicrobiales bacterium]